MNFDEALAESAEQERREDRAMSEHWTDKPHTHGGTDCGGGEGCPAHAPVPAPPEQPE